MSLKKTNILIAIFILLMTSGLLAQRKFDFHKGKVMWRHWYIDAKIGYNVFYGDITSYNIDLVEKYKEESKVGYALGLGKWVESWIGVEGNLMHGKLRGVKDTLISNTTFNQATGEVIINFTQLIYPSNIQTPFYFYGKLGAGLNYFSSTLTHSKTGAVIKTSGNPYNIEWMIPISFGGAYNITENFSLTATASYTYINTDKLDATYTNKPDDSNDFYLSLFFGAKYTFSLKQSKGSYRRPRSRRGTNWLH